MNHRAAAGITQEQPPEPQRRELLKCMLWAGSALLWTVSAGIPKSRLISNAYAGDAPTEGFSFAQISDSHIGFPGPANVDVTGTLQLAMRHVVALKKRTSLLIHTGDISHLGQDKELDTAKQIIDSAGFETHYVPGEHDMLVDNGKGFYARFSPKDARARRLHPRYPWGAFHSLEQCLQLSCRRIGAARSRSARVGEARFERAPRKSAHYYSGAHAALVDLSRVGLGYGRIRRPPCGLETLWLRNRTQWPHSSSTSKGGGSRDIPHGAFDGLSFAAPGVRPRPYPSQTSRRQARGSAGYGLD